MSDKYIGDFQKGQVIRVKFNTFSQAIVPSTPSINPTVAIYKDSATEFTTGVTQPSVNFDGKAGFHELVVDTSDAVYEIGKDYDIVFTAGTVDGKDLTRTILRTFSIENRNVDANVTRIAGQTASAAAPVTFPASVANETTLSNRATQASVNAIPTNPLLTTDSRLNNLDTTISSRMPSGNVTVGGYAAGQDPATLVWNATTRTLTAFGFNVTVGTNNDKTGYSLIQTFPANFSSLAITAGGSITAGTVTDKTGYSLNQAFPTNFALLSIDASGRTLLQPTQTGVTIPTVTSLTDGVSVSINNDKTGYSLVTAYDAAKTAASQSSVNSIPLNPLLTNDARLNSLSNLDAAVSTRLASTSYVSPDNTSIGAIKTITDQITFTSGRVNSVLSQSFPSNFASMSIDASGKVLLQPSQTGVTIPVVTSVTNNVLFSAPDVRSAVGLATNNLDAQLTTVTNNTTNIQSRIPASLVNGRINSTVGEMQNDVINSGALAATASAEIADAVWDEQYSQHTTAGTFGKLMDIMRKANTLIEGTVTAAVTPSTTTFSSTVNYPTGALEHTVLLWITGPLAEQNSPILTYNNTSGTIVAEEAFTQAPQVGNQFVIAPLLHVHSISGIQSGLALQSTSQTILSNTNTLLSRITAGVFATFGDLAAMIQGTGTDLVKWTASALSLAPSGGGGGGGNVTVNANILPIQSYMRKRIESETISLFYNESTDIFITLEDENGPIDVTGKTLEFVIETKNKTNLIVISNGNITKSSTGVSVRISTEVTANVGTYLWALRDLTGGDTVLSHGFAEVSYAPKS